MGEGNNYNNGNNQQPWNNQNQQFQQQPYQQPQQFQQYQQPNQYNYNYNGYNQQMPNKQGPNKVVLIIVIAVIIGLLCCCGIGGIIIAVSNGSSDSDVETTTTTSEGSGSSKLSHSKKSDSKSSNDKEGIFNEITLSRTPIYNAVLTDVSTIEPQEIYNSNGIIIKATELKYDSDGTEAKLYLSASNSSSRKVYIRAEHASVNGYMTTTTGRIELNPGESGEGKISLYTQPIYEETLTGIGEIGLVLNIHDSDTYEAIDMTDLIKIKTSIYDSYTQDYDDSGELILNQSGIKIVAKGIAGEGTECSNAYILYIENNSDLTAYIRVDGAELDDEYVEDVIFLEDVLPGTVSEKALDFNSKDVGKTVYDISKVKFTLQVWDYDTFDNILEDQEITINIK
jgi:hypothetical protein